MKKFASLIFLALYLLSPEISWAASGSNYPTTIDAWADKASPDQITYADFNARTSAIEKLESGPLRPNKGSASAPAYSFQGNINIGLDSLAANRLDLITAGLSRITIDSSGNVGVGLTNPGTPLEVLKSTPIINTIVDVLTIQAKTTGIFAAGFGPTIMFNGSMTGQDNIELAHFGAVNINGAGAFGELVFYTRPNGPSQESMRISYNGKVGIGTSSPNEGLEMGATLNVRIPNIKSTTGTRYVCVNTNGTLVSSASACSGT